MQRGKDVQTLQWVVEGRRFRNTEEYEAAMRDKQLIDLITQGLDLGSAKDVKKVYEELRHGRYQFESIVGRQFDDNVYELYSQVKKQEEEAEAEKEKRKEARRLKRVERKERQNSKCQSKKEKLPMEKLDKQMRQEIMQELHRKEKRRIWISVISSLICITCFGYLAYYYWITQKSANDFAQLAELKGDTGQVTGNAYFDNRQVTVHMTEGEKAAPKILAEYETLYQKNKKLIGWIKIEDTLIDYPVMQTVNNDYYLNHNFNQEEDKNGCIFMDYQCDVIAGCDNIILYGHHMQSGKMFGGLNKYSSEAYYKEHPEIQFDTIYEKGVYQIMYVFRSKVYSEEDVTFKYYQFINAGSKQEFDSYMKEMQALSLYDTGVTAAYGDKLLTLSTCDYQENDGRFVVVAKRVN